MKMSLHPVERIGRRMEKSVFYFLCARNYKRNILSSIKPLTVLSNWIYFSTFSIKDDKIVVSRLKELGSIIFLVFSLIIKCLKMVWYSYPGFEQIIVNLTMCLLLTFCLASFLNCLIQGRSIAKLWNEILRFSCFITDNTFYWKAFGMTCFQLIGFNSLFVVYLSMYYFFYPEEFNSFFFCLENVVDHCIIMHFCGIQAFFYNGLYFGTKLISLANEELIKLKRIEYYNDCKRWKGLDFIKIERMKILRSQLRMIKAEDLSPLIDIYDRLCGYYEELNECFGVSLTASCLNNLAQMTLSCYFMAKHGWEAARLFLVWFCYCFIFEWTLLKACENFTKETKRTSLLTDLVVTDNSSQVLKDAVQRFSRHLLHRPMKITACRLFDLNYRLLYSVATNIITYLVIVIQFDSSENTSADKKFQNLV